MATSTPSIAVPGLRLGDSSTFTSGPGTYVRDSSICASIAGPVILKTDDRGTDPKRKPRKILTVSRSPQTDTPQPHTKTTTGQIPSEIQHPSGRRLYCPRPRNPRPEAPGNSLNTHGHR